MLHFFFQQAQVVTAALDSLARPAAAGCPPPPPPHTGSAAAQAPSSDRCMLSFVVSRCLAWPPRGRAGTSVARARLSAVLDAAPVCVCPCRPVFRHAARDVAQAGPVPCPPHHAGRAATEWVRCQVSPRASQGSCAGGPCDAPGRPELRGEPGGVRQAARRGGARRSGCAGGDLHRARAGAAPRLPAAGPGVKMRVLRAHRDRMRTSAMVTHASRVAAAVCPFRHCLKLCCTAHVTSAWLCPLLHVRAARTAC